MDGSRFDRLARTWGTRRTAIGGLLGGILLPLLSDEGDARKQRHGNGRDKDRRTSQHRGNHDRDKDKRADRLSSEKKKKKKCKGGTLKCGKKLCVNASTDAQNCGSCGNRCSAGAACVGGVCQSPSPGCPPGQISCGGGCVDPGSDEAHCGGCGQQCQGDLTCLDGVCGCADTADTKCGNLCVDIQSDAGNCGQCGQACGAEQRCQGGQCVDQVECHNQDECGGSTYNDLVCRNGRCVCSDPAKGICQRYPDGRGSCHICCPGGSGQCPGNRGEVCSYYQTPSGGWAGICNCPADWDRCVGSDICVADTSTDPRNCGRFCRDCQARQDVNPKGFCCNGGCAAGCAPGFSGSGCYPGDPCGENCEPCADDHICCNQGPGTEPRCIPRNGAFCYREAQP